MFWVYILDSQSPSNSAGGSRWSTWSPWSNLPCHPHCSHVVGVSGLPEYLLFLCREGGLGMEWTCLSLRDWRSFLPLMPLRHLFSPSWWNVTGINKESASSWPETSGLQWQLLLRRVKTIHMFTFIWVMGSQSCWLTDSRMNKSTTHLSFGCQLICSPPWELERILFSLLQFKQSYLGQIGK